MRLQRQLAKRRARSNYLEFIEWVWQKPWPFVRGQHTIEIAALIDQGIENFLAGASTYLDLEVVYRHGKTDLVSRYLPAYFLGRCFDKDPDLIMTGYGASLVLGFSRDARAIIRDPRYQELFPKVELQRGSNSTSEWRLEGKTGVATWQGLGGSLTGKGAGLLVIDDYCKNKAEARSLIYRNATDEAISDAITRVAPVHFVILCATSWHVDDARARIRQRMKTDPHHPQFFPASYPARKADGTYLMPERYPATWYEAQYATQGRWGHALLDCNPIFEGGNRFNVSTIKIHDDKDGWPEIPEKRCWDLASTSKERDKDDPDYTIGIRGCITDARRRKPTKWEDEPLHLWISHIVAGQWEAPERKRKIRGTATQDGAKVRIYVEAYGAYKDAYTTLRESLKGIRTVNRSRLPGDKSAKSADLEPIFDAGNVHITREAYDVLDSQGQRIFERHFREAFDGPHDDVVDAAAILYHESKTGGTGILQMA